MVDIFAESLPLQVPPQFGLNVTYEQFVALAAVNDLLRLERTATGELIIQPPTGGNTGWRNANIIGQLGAWCNANDSLGIAFSSSTGCDLPNGATRSPDTSWVSKARWDSAIKKGEDCFVPLCPDFVVELLGNDEILKDTQGKMEEYMENGAKLGWLINPENQQVEIYRPGQAVEILKNPSSLSGEDILPGFVLNLKRIWE